MVHETVTGEFDTLQSDRHVDVIKPFLRKETDVNVGDFKRWLVHEHRSKKTASHVGNTTFINKLMLYYTLSHMTPTKPSHIFWTHSKIQVYWGRICLTKSDKLAKLHCIDRVEHCKTNEIQITAQTLFVD